MSPATIIMLGTATRTGLNNTINTENIIINIGYIVMLLIYLSVLISFLKK